MKRIAVYCGSREGASPIYVEMARKLGTELAKEQITLIYGGGSVGLKKLLEKLCTCSIK